MAVPKYLCRIDFNFDGDFVDADEDVTSDIRNTGVFSWKITRGQDLLKRRFEAAMLEVYLENSDGTQKYSPYVAGSPFNNALTNKSHFPAMNIWFMMGYPVDDFNASNGTTLTSRKPSHDDLFDAWEGDTANFDVQSNKLRATAANNSAVLNFGEVDCFVGCKFTRENSTSGLILRWADASNYLLVRSDGSNLILSKVDAGSLSTIATVANTWTAGDEKFILVELHGEEVRVSIDDTLILDTTTNFNSGVTGSSTTAATKHGVGGRPADASSRWEDFGGWRSMFFGRIDEVDPRPETHNQYVYIRALDDMERMNGYQVYRVAPAAPTTAGDILNEILDAVEARGFDAGLENRIIDAGITLTHNAQHQKSMGRDGLTEAYQLQDDDVGLFYIDGQGFYRYEGSSHRKAGRHTEEIQTWRTNRAVGDETDMYVAQRFEWDDGRELIENDIWYLYDKISTVTSAVEVWRFNDTSAITDDKPAILNGQTLSFLAIGDGDVIASPTTPVATTDFLVNTAKDGTGSDLTASVTAALVTGFEGNFRQVQLTNNSGSNGFVTFLRLRATKHERSARAGAKGEDSDSQTNNGRRAKEHITLHIDEFDTAQDRVDERINLRSLARETVIVDMQPGSRANLMQIIHRSIGDRIAFVYDSLSLNNKFRIEGKQIVGRSGGRDITCTWKLLEAFGGGWTSGFKWRAALTDADSFTWA